MDGKVEVLIPEEDVRTRIREMADVISAKYRNGNLILIGVLSGAVYFLTELAQNLTVPVEIDFMAASSYGNATESSGKVLIKKDLDRSITGKNVVIVEDIVDTGRTLHLLTEMLKARKPESIEIAVLLDKPDRRKVCADADYVGFEIPDEFVIGWGLDYEQKFRDLPFIGILKK